MATRNISLIEDSVNGITTNRGVVLAKKTDLQMAIGNINSPLLDMPLKNSLAMKAGVGSATFTRASTATYIDRYGVLKTAAIDESRFEKEGYLNEGSSTNLLTYSEDFNNAVWSSGAFSSEAKTAEVTDPYGNTNATKLIATSGITSTFIQQAVSSTTVTDYALSVFVKKGTDRYIVLNLGSADDWSSPNPLAIFDLDTGLAVTSSWSEKVDVLANGWFRISVKTTKTAAHTSPYIRFYTSDTTSITRLASTNGTEYTYIFGAQLEALPFATSYIPTTSTTVTRAVDKLTVTASGHVGLHSNTISLMADFDSFGVVGAGHYPKSIYIANTIGGYASVQLLTGNNGALQSYLYRNPVGSAAFNINTNTKYRHSAVMQNTSGSFYVNGTLVESKNTYTTNSYKLEQIWVGSEFGNNHFHYGHITNIRIWDNALTAQEVALA